MFQSYWNWMNQDNNYFVYEYNRIKNKIHYGDIVYFESDRKHIKIICSDGTERIFVGKLVELIRQASV